jgi:rhodanese-related sulfurtransferase
MFRRSTVPAASPAEAHDRAEGHALIDVREPHEWAAGHAPDAVHLPLDELEPARLPAAERLLCICRSGARSSRAVAVLRSAGYDAVNVEGGMNAWQADGLPVVCDDGNPGAVA